MHPVLFQIGQLIVPSYGAVAAVGVLLALAFAQVTARRARLDSRHAWNMLVLAVFAGLAASRLLLIVLNLSDLRRHPSWLLTIAMVHHPLLAAAGILGALIVVGIYVHWARLRLSNVADALAVPILLGLAAEQLGALLSGSDYGRERAAASFPQAVVFDNPLALRWSGTPLGVPLYPVQAYASLGALLLAGLCYAWFYFPRRRGDVAGVALIGAGVLLFLTEMFRDWEGRGVLLRGMIDAPQLVGLGMVLTGALALLKWPAASIKLPKE